jgi:energy-coupling factor transporter ATP-binding protein EcfA2
MKLFRELNDAGLTIIMVTHEPDVAAHARRTVVMRDGQIRSDERREPPASVAQPPVHPKGHSFFGFAVPRAEHSRRRPPAPCCATSCARF